MAKPEGQRIPSPPHYLGYLRTCRILDRLCQFRDLSIRCDRWASLLVYRSDNQSGPTRRHPTEMERQFNQLATPVARHLDMVGVDHRMTLFGGATGTPLRKVEVDLLADFTTLPERYREQRLEALICSLDLAIGAYEQHKRKAIRRWFNPLFWILVAIRTPVSIVEFLGQMSTREEQSRLVKLCGWPVRIAFLFVLGFLAVLLTS